jgi:hypothetical protein
MIKPSRVGLKVILLMFNMSHNQPLKESTTRLIELGGSC